MPAAELLLPRLNQALANILVACDALLEGPINDEGETAEQVFNPIMRRLLLCQTLGQYSLLAVAGTQGAGKTTLIKSLYELEGEDAAWLRPNEGRGETYPILVTEGEPEAPAEGFVWKLERVGGERKVARVPLLDGSRTVAEAQLEFQRACSQTDANELLVELRLPGKLKLGDCRGWLLLPGYETKTLANEAWQTTMRAALAGASSAIIVTDETRLARDQSDLARDALSTAFGDISPVVVISKTEGFRDNPDRLEDLEARAAEVFGVPSRQVQCIGLADDPEYNRKWREELKEKIEQFLVYAGDGTRDLWRSALTSLVQQDLKRALASLNRQLRVVLAAPEGANAQADLVNEMLEMFDEANEGLRERYSGEIQNAVNAHAGKAATWMEKHLAEEFEGLKNHARSFFFDTESESIIRLKEGVAEADRQAGLLAPRVAEALKRPVQRVLSPERGDNSQLAPLLVDCLADGQKFEVIPWTSGGGIEREDTPAHALVTLFSDEQSEQAGKKLVGLETAIKILPALALEWTRVANEMPVTNQPDLVEPHATLDPLQFTLNNAGPAASNAQILMRTVAATILAADVAELSEQADDAITAEADSADGTGNGDAAIGAAATAAMAKVVPTLFANPVFLAGTAVVAAGYLTSSMLQEIRAYDRANRVSALGMIQRTGEFRYRGYMNAYDDMMSAMRENLKQALRRRYRVADSLAKKDRIVHAIAVAQQLREEMIEAMDGSAYGALSLRVQLTDAM